MQSRPSHASPGSAALSLAVPGIDVDAVVAQAHLLQRIPAAGADTPLRGKNLGLLCTDDDSEASRLFQRAAGELGARVAQVRPSFSTRSSAQEIRHTATVLGRLYDAIECLDVEAPTVLELRLHAGVPVFDGLARQDGPLAQLVHLLAPGSRLEDRRRWLVQSILLATVR